MLFAVLSECCKLRKNDKHMRVGVKHWNFTPTLHRTTDKKHKITGLRCINTVQADM